MAFRDPVWIEIATVVLLIGLVAPIANAVFGIGILLTILIVTGVLTGVHLAISAVGYFNQNVAATLLQWLIILVGWLFLLLIVFGLCVLLWKGITWVRG